MRIIQTSCKRDGTNIKFMTTDDPNLNKVETGNEGGNEGDNHETKPDGSEEQPASQDKSEDKSGESEDKIDYKEKFSASTAENQRMLEYFKANNIDPKTLQPITNSNSNDFRNDIDLSAFEDPNGEIDATQKEFLSEMAKMIDERKFDKELADVLKDHPNLDKEKFRTYAYDGDNKRVPLKILAKSFLFENPVKTEVKTEKRNTEKGNGGPKPDRTDGKKVYTSEEVAKLRTNSPEEYTRLIRSGKLVIED